MLRLFEHDRGHDRGSLLGGEAGPIGDVDDQGQMFGGGDIALEKNGAEFRAGRRCFLRPGYPLPEPVDELLVELER